MTDTCTTGSTIPFWVTIGFFGGAFIMLLVTSYYSYQHVKSTQNKSVKLLHTTDDIQDNVTETPETNKDNVVLALHLSDKDLGSTISGYNAVNTNDDDKAASINTESTDTPATKDEKCTCNCPLKSWFADIWGRKAVYVPLILHLMDTSTDFAAIVEFYQIGTNSSPQDCGDLNIWWLFLLSIAAMFAYRSISSYTIWRITDGDWKRVAMQFIDIELFEVLYISHRLKLKNESSPQRLLSVLEAIFEAAPQSMIQMIYLLKTGNLSGVVFVSSILSFIFLTMTICNDDKKFLNEFSRLIELITLYLFRICDIPASILTYVFIWYYTSGYILTIVAFIDMIVAIICFKITNSTDALQSVIATPFSFGKYETMKKRNILKMFWVYSLVRCIAIHTLIWIMITIDENDITDDAFTATFWCFCFSATIIRYCLGVVLLKKFKVYDRYGHKVKEKNDINTLVSGGYYDDAMELIFYKSFEVEKNMSKQYGRDKYPLLEIAFRCQRNWTILPYILNILHINVDINLNDKDKYANILFLAAEKRNKKLIEQIMKNANYGYICKESKDGDTALTVVIRGSKGVDDGVVAAFLEGAAKIIGNNSNCDKKKKDLLENRAAPKGYKNSFHFAIQQQVPLAVFQVLWEFYPKDYAEKRRLIYKGINVDGRNINLMSLCDKQNTHQIKEFLRKQVPRKATKEQIELVNNVLYN
eukprot:420300_1